MNFKMLGIDHNKAKVTIRESFSFTTARSITAMKSLMAQPGITGCLILSTCNRTEVWCSYEEDREPDLFQWFCEYTDKVPANYAGYFTSRQGVDAVRHLFDLCSGLKSMIVGEDQILTQVKDALRTARENDTSGTALNVLFQMAVAAGKKVKTQVRLPRGNSSAAGAAVNFLKSNGYTLKDKKCLVIGNGEIGQLTALALKEEGADVTVTVRQYKSGIVCIPDGCKRINYGERYRYLPECHFIFSATSSPNTTITADAVNDIHTVSSQVYMDLAVPRDIDPGIASLPDRILYDMDSLNISSQSEEMKQQYAAAKAILEAKVLEFMNWYECRDLIPRIQFISQKASADGIWRMKKTVKQSSFPVPEQKEITEVFQNASVNTVSKLIYTLRDHLEPDTFRNCLDVLYESYGEEKWH